MAEDRVRTNGGNRRIDKVLAPSFVEGLPELDMDDLRTRRDLSRAEREYLSLVRRLLQGRRDILQAELERRRSGGRAAAIADQLAAILADAPGGPSRGEAMVLTLPEDELMLARRSVEKLLSDARLSDLPAIDDTELESSIARLEDEEKAVSEVRTKVMAVHDVLQDELKDRWREKVRHLESEHTEP